MGLGAGASAARSCVAQRVQAFVGIPFVRVDAASEAALVRDMRANGGRAGDRADVTDAAVGTDGPVEYRHCTATGNERVSGRW